MKKKKVDIAKETRSRSREAIGQVPKTRRIEDKKKKRPVYPRDFGRSWLEDW